MVAYGGFSLMKDGGESWSSVQGGTNPAKLASSFISFILWWLLIKKEKVNNLDLADGSFGSSTDQVMFG